MSFWYFVWEMAARGGLCWLGGIAGIVLIIVLWVKTKGGRE
jgi:hypothetical protein